LKVSSTQAATRCCVHSVTCYAKLGAAPPSHADRKIRYQCWRCRKHSMCTFNECNRVRATTRPRNCISKISLQNRLGNINFYRRRKRPRIAATREMSRLVGRLANRVALAGGAQDKISMLMALQAQHVHIQCMQPRARHNAATIFNFRNVASKPPREHQFLSPTEAATS